MKTKTLTTLLLLAALSGAGQYAHAHSLARPERIDVPSLPLIEVSAGCYGVAERAAREAGGKVVGVREAMQNGRPVCIVRVSIPRPDGKRPHLKEIVVPR